MLVTGKGGVGKTTVALEVARQLAARGKVAFAELGVAACPDAAPAPAGVESLRIDSDDAVMDAAAEVFGSRRVARALLGRSAMKRLMQVIPGIREYALMVAALRLTSVYDHVVVDMPATGHGLTWLTAADTLGRLVPSGRARSVADAIDAALRDPTVTALVVVTLAEPIVSAETAELRAELAAGLGRADALLVVNRVDADCPDVTVSARALAERDPAAAPDVAAYAAWEARRRHTRACAARLARDSDRTVFVHTQRVGAAQLTVSTRHEGA